MNVPEGAFFFGSGNGGKTAIGWLIVVRSKVRGGRADCGSRIASTTKPATLTHEKPHHPGEILATMYLEPLGLTVTQAVVALNMPRAGLSEIVNGRRAVTALRLQKAFNQLTTFWLSVQSAWELIEPKFAVAKPRSRKSV